jgi:hypothetical protein
MYFPDLKMQSSRYVSKPIRGHSFFIQQHLGIINAPRIFNLYSCMGPAFLSHVLIADLAKGHFLAPLQYQERRNPDPRPRGTVFKALNKIGRLHCHAKSVCHDPADGVLPIPREGYVVFSCSLMGKVISLSPRY